MLLTVGLIILLLFLSLEPIRFFPNAFSAYDPNSEFSLSANRYTPQKRSGLFTINIKIGSISFGQAKFLDISQDIVSTSSQVILWLLIKLQLIGRGGQATLAIFAYKVFTKGLIRTIQSTAIPHNTFRAITLQNNTVYRLLMLIRNFPRIIKRHATSTTLQIAQIILLASFVLMILTQLSAITDYVSELRPYTTLLNDTRVPLEKAFRPVIYTIHDGTRLSKPFTNTTYVLLVQDDPRLDTNNNYYNCRSVSKNNNRTITTDYKNLTDITGCRLIQAVSRYTSIYSFFGLNNTKTTFQLPTLGNATTQPLLLDEPSLNITASFAVSRKASPLDYRVLGSRYWAGWPYGMNESAFQKPLFYNVTGGTVHDENQMKDIYKCQQTKLVKYQQRFSFLLLYTFIVYLILQIISIWSYYFGAVMHSHLND